MIRGELLSRLLRFLAVAGVCCTAFACALKAPVSDMSIDDVIADAEKKAYLVKRFSADFVKTRKMSVFERPLTVEGRLVFEKPDRYRLTTSGDVNVEILSNGDFVSVVHDLKDREVFHIEGDRDLLRFSDPLMILIQSIGRGGLRDYSYATSFDDSNELLIKLVPEEKTPFENVKQALVWFSGSGVSKVRLDFKNGNYDETEFRSWRALTRDDPEILAMHSKLQSVSEQIRDPEFREAKPCLECTRRTHPFSGGLLHVAAP